MTTEPIGRNDPCPCGSGKKYKNCCMRKDRLEAARNASVRGEEAAMYASLAQFVLQPRFSSALAEGISVFWRGQYAQEASSAIDSEGVRRMIEWFVLEYAYGPDRTRLIDLYIKTETPRFVESLQRLVAAVAKSRMGLFRYVARGDSEHLNVMDPLADVRLSIRSRLLAQNARPGDLLVGRLYELDDEACLTPATLVLPQAFEAPMLQYVRNARTIYLDEHPGASLDQFLRANGHIFNAFLLSERAESLRGLIGAGTRFLDPAVVRDRMREITHEVQQRQTSQAATTMSDAPEVHTHRSAGGIVLPGMDRPEAEDGAATQTRPTILIPGRDT